MHTTRFPALRARRPRWGTRLGLTLVVAVAAPAGVLAVESGARTATASPAPALSADDSVNSAANATQTASRLTPPTSKGAGTATTTTGVPPSSAPGGQPPSLGSDVPIFPMQTAPRCFVLNNFSDARSGGRSHEGTDMLATLGQEVYAVVDGTLGWQVIDGGADSSLSGNAWRLTSAVDKTYYMYAHLSRFADGLTNGSIVKQGQVIGYVGDTGNPGAGNYHLHFEYHPAAKKGAAVNALTVLTVPKECSVQ